MAAIETDAVSRLEPTGRVAQIGARCLGQQVKVIRHQAIRMDYEPETLNGLFKGLQKPLPIAIIAINWLPFVAAGRGMIRGAFKLYSDRACHNARYDTATPLWPTCETAIKCRPRHPRHVSPHACAREGTTEVV